MDPEVEFQGDGLKEVSPGGQPSLDFFDEERGVFLSTLLTEEVVAPSSIPTRLSPLPAQREDAVRHVGKRSAPAEVQVLIAQLCEIRPYTHLELSLILNRSPKHIYQTYLKSMFRDGILELLIPESPGSPKQAYRVRSRENEE